jgi:hypothetical protein
MSKRQARAPGTGAIYQNIQRIVLIFHALLINYAESIIMRKGGLLHRYPVLSEHPYFPFTAISPLWGDLLNNRDFYKYAG